MSRADRNPWPSSLRWLRSPARPPGSARTHELVDARAHVGDLLARKLGVDGQSQGFARGRFGLGKGTLAPPQIREALLHVERARIVDLGADAGRAEVLLESVASSRADDELVVDVPGGGPRDRKLDGGSAQKLTVERRVALPGRM